MTVSGLHLDSDSFVILSNMKNTVRLLAMTLIAAVVSCTPYRQENGKPMPPGALSASPPPPTDYPYAEKTSTPGLVISPYAPYNVMDVNGLRTGKLALDPSCQKKFRVP